MRHPIAFFAAVATSLALLSPAARAVGTLVDVEIVDRSTGETLTPIRAKGEWWIAGRPGARYGVTIRSRTPLRTLSVVSIDGVNAVSGDTAAWSQTGYVLSPYERTQIDGWRKDMNRIAAFEFTALPDSYAARTGRPANVGVIGVAMFAERRPAPVARREVAPVEADRAPLAGAAEPAPPAPPSSTLDEAQSARSPAPMQKAEPGAERYEYRARIGTGHGEIENSTIEYVSFRRAQPTPNEIVTIHYDRLQNLVAMGIVPPRVATGTTPRPFPDSGRFVADPPAR